MFGLFGNKEETGVKIFFGSTEEGREETTERTSPFDGKVVSLVPVCTAEDAKRALKVADDASKSAAKAPAKTEVT